MPPQKPAARKRVRKRKRRAASSSSSSDSSSDSDSDGPQQITIPKPTTSTAPAKTVPPPVAQEESSSEESSSESDSASSSSSSESDEDVPAIADEMTLESSNGQPAKSQRKPPSRSPSPRPTELPPFLPAAGEGREEQEKILKDRFRKFWMESIADGFKDDLEEIRKEPNMNTSRLALLIDSLASGSEVFTSSSKNGINEMEVVLG